MLDITFFEEKLNSKLRGKLTVIDFCAEWCYPCKIMGTYLKSLKEALEDTINVIQIHLDEGDTDFERNKDIFKTIAEMKNINGIPYLLIFDENGKFVGDVLGSNTEKLLNILNNILKKEK